MKLGYIYTVTSGGYDDEKVRINAGDWSSVVEDERQLWLKFSDNGESLAMTIVRDGVAFAITRIIGGDRADNNITTWVFIPSKIQITGSQVKQIVEAVKEINKLGTKRVSLDSFMSNDILAADYPEKKHPVLFTASKGDKLAGRYPTTDFSMEEILGNAYQEYYTNFKYVFLYNQKNDLKEGLTNLSNYDIIETICVIPPSAETIKRIFGSSNVKISFSDKSSFSTSRLVKKGHPIPLFAEKEGCVTMSIMGQAVADDREIEIPVGNYQWKRFISSDHFKVTDAVSGNLIPKYSFEIKDSQYNRIENSLPENRLENVSIHVTAVGYEPYEGVVNLNRGTITISLEKKIESQTYKYYSGNGHELKVTISGVGAKSTCPLQGYEAKGQKLVYVGPTKEQRGAAVDSKGASKNSSKPRFAWKAFCLGAFTIIILMLILWGGLKLVNLIFNDKPQSLDVAIEAVDENTSNAQSDDISDPNPSVDQADLDLNAAISYLDSNNVWDKSELEKYPDLKGLFDDLNNMDTEKIVTIWAEVLKNSSNFKKVSEAAKKNLNNNWNPKQKEHDPTYNTNPGDYKINLINYTNWLDQDQSPNNSEKPQGASTTQSIPKEKDNMTSTPSEKTQKPAQPKPSPKGNGKEASNSSVNKIDPKIS